MKDKLTKREKFALGAMKALLKKKGISHENDFENIPAQAVKIADVMIKKLKT